MVDFYHIWKAEQRGGRYADYLKWLASQWEDYVIEVSCFGDLAMQSAINDPAVRNNFHAWLLGKMPGDIISIETLEFA